jgi:hypothetical protein
VERGEERLKLLNIKKMERLRIILRCPHFLIVNDFHRRIYWK